uniref:SH3 domain-containing protein n=1 Tax=Rhabditophanes sp. KR3021 TaxID=114890 RepID=A0AC35UH34_9BILA
MSETNLVPEVDKNIPVDINVVYRAIAKFDFEGKKNDEVTQMEKEGWWEGMWEATCVDGKYEKTFNDHVGWFPENYVSLIEEDIYEEINPMSVNLNNKGSGNSSGKGYDRQFREQAITEFIEYIAKINEEAKSLINDIVMRLKDVEDFQKDDDIMSFVDIATQISLFLDTNFLQQLQLVNSLPLIEQRIGGVMLKNAQEYKNLLKKYCALHPTIIQKITQVNLHKSKIVEQVCNTPLKDIVIALSSFFRNIETYSNHLAEIERNSQSNHSDLGDLRRGNAVYRSLASFILAVRKEKEAELDFVGGNFLSKFDKSAKYPGPLKWIGLVGWKRENSNDDSLNLQHIHFALFEDKMLFMELSVQKASYSLLNCMEVKNTFIRKNIDKKFSLGIGDENTNKFIVYLNNNNDFEILCDAFDQIKVNKNVTIEEGVLSNPTSPIPQHKTLFRKSDGDQGGVCSELTSINDVILRQPRNQTPKDTTESSRREKANSDSKKKSGSDFIGGIRVNHDIGMICLDSEDDYCEPPITPLLNRSRKSFLSRPLPPSIVMQKYGIDSDQPPNVRLRKQVNSNDLADTLLLDLINDFYNAFRSNSGGDLSASSSQAVIQLNDNQPQLIVAEQEKILIEETDETGNIVLKEKSLVDTVYSLKDTISRMEKELAQMKNVVK